jgi:hypothetical protein
MFLSIFLIKIMADIYTKISDRYLQLNFNRFNNFIVFKDALIDQLAGEKKELQDEKIRLNQLVKDLDQRRSADGCDG